MADFRSVETEKNDTLMLKEYFGDSVTIKQDNPLRKLQHEYERTLKLPF